MSKQAGFSLVELVFSAVIGGLIMAAGLSLAIQQRSFYTTAADAAYAISSLNGLELTMAGEVLPLNAAAGDLIHAGPDSMRLRLFRGVYSVCDVALTPAALTMKRLTQGGEPAAGDSAFVYSQGVTSQIQDDLWERFEIKAVTAATCPDGSQAWRLTFWGLNSTQLGQLPAGAPLRVFGRASYWFDQRDDGWYLTRTDRDGTALSIAGPLRQPGSASVPPAFRYYDANGTPTTVPANVARLEITANAVRFVTQGPQPTTAQRTLTFRFRNE